MAQPNNAVLTPSPVRPNDLADNYASAWAIDIKGGLHSVETIAQRDATLSNRREWGMLCVVYLDPTPENNGIYQLVRGKSDTNILTNDNWVRFTVDSNSGGGEWISSVKDIISSPPGTNQKGDRYLVGSPGIGAFLNNDYKIAQWDDIANGGAGAWVFTQPSEGFTVRVDNNKNVLYKFTGTYSENGIWKKEYLNQVRYIQPTSANGVTYTFTSSTDITALDAYSYSVYIAKFGAANTGACQLQIDGLGYLPLKKSLSGSEVDLDASDISTSLQYQVTWNNGTFFVHLGGGGAVGVIGPAEDPAGYTDGLFTDFTPNTPIGIPIDRFNEILLGLVPPQAPPLQDWSMNTPSFVDGKISFNSLTVGFTPVPGGAIGSDFNASGKRKGITSKVSQTKTTVYYNDYTGDFNPAAISNQSPIPAYPAKSFGDGLTGSIIMRLNGVTISNVDLSSTYGQINQAGSGSGVILSAATASKFPTGTPFETYWSRTGQFIIKKDDANLKTGFNYLDLRHRNTPSFDRIIASFSWVADASAAETSFTSQQLKSTTAPDFISTANKTLSGIKFIDSLSLIYRVTIQNHANNTYIGTSNALSTVCEIPTPTDNPNGVNSKITTTNTPVMNPSLSGQSITTPAAPSSPMVVDSTFALNTSVRRMNERMNFRIIVNRTVQGQDSGGTLTVNNWFIDNYPTPTNKLDNEEEFDQETRRMVNGSTKYTTIHDSISSLPSWDSTKSLYTDAAHRNGLQVINGQLVYPRFNFSGVGFSYTNPNFSLGSSVNYSLCNTISFGFSNTGDSSGTKHRTFTRKFYLGLANYTSLEFKITFTDTEFVSATTPLSGNKCWAEVKLPYKGTDTVPDGGLVGGAVTGWMDMYIDYSASTGTQNGAGAKKGSIGTSGNSWKVMFGGKGTFYSGGIVIFRFTASENWAGHLSKITCYGA